MAGDEGRSGRCRTDVSELVLGAGASIRARGPMGVWAVVSTTGLVKTSWVLTTLAGLRRLTWWKPVAMRVRRG